MDGQTDTWMVAEPCDTDEGRRLAFGYQESIQINIKSMNLNALHSSNALWTDVLEQLHSNRAVFDYQQALVLGSLPKRQGRVIDIVSIKTS